MWNYTYSWVRCGEGRYNLSRAVRRPVVANQQYPVPDRLGLDAPNLLGDISFAVIGSKDDK